MIIALQQGVQAERFGLRGRYTHPLDRVLTLVHQDLVERLVAESRIVAYW